MSESTEDRVSESVEATEGRKTPGLSPSDVNISVQPCDMQVIALKDWQGEELDDLSFKKGDVISVKKKDAAGWASGTLKNQDSGWFPLDCTEPVFDNAVAEVGTATKESALDVFIKEAKEKKTVVPSIGAIKSSAPGRNHSLTNFLAQKAMHEATIDDVEPTGELEAAQKRLLKAQKKRKTERAEVLIENLRQDWTPSNLFKISEIDFDRVIELIADMETTKQKYHFSSYDDVLSGSEIILNLQLKIKTILPDFSCSKADLKEFCQTLVERNVIFDVADPGRKKFKSSGLYQLQGRQTEYSVMNFDKICAVAPDENGYQLSVQLIGEMIELMKKYLPKIGALRKSNDLLLFGLRLALLQRVSLDILTQEEKKIFFINLHNLMVLYLHAKLSPPANTSDRRFMFDHCSIYVNQKRYSLTDIENEAIQFASKEDPSVFFCLSDCTTNAPAVFLFSTENYDELQLFAVRHYLRRTLIVDGSNYEMIFPKMFQKIMKDLKLEKEALVDLVSPYCSSEHRTHITEMRSVGDIEVKLAQQSFTPHYVFEELSPLSPR